MPQQRGKRRNKPGSRRPRSGNGAYVSDVTPPAPAPRPTAGGSRPRRRGFDLPWWGDLIAGGLLLLLGLIYSFLAVPKGGETLHYVFLILYLVLAGFYLSRGFRKYRGQRQS